MAESARGCVAGAVERALAGDPRGLARLISAVEDGVPELREIMAALVAPQEPAAPREPVPVVGLTGSPGVGKSTVTAALVGAYRERGLRVGVLAIDPTSPFTGGALLGDRVRMQHHAADPGVFIRSMATRGNLGGLARATPQALRVLGAAGFGVLLVETVGVGQAEVDVASLADTTLVLAAPGMGDAIQAAKAGVLEIADVLVVNKADHPAAQETVRDLRMMIAMGHRDGQDWKPPIVATVAPRGEGIDELVGRIDAHWSWLAESGQGEVRRQVRAREEITAIAAAELRARAAGLDGQDRLDALAARVAAGSLDAFAAAAALLAAATA